MRRGSSVHSEANSLGSKAAQKQIDDQEVDIHEYDHQNKEQNLDDISAQTFGIRGDGFQDPKINSPFFQLQESPEKEKDGVMIEYREILNPEEGKARINNEI